MTTDQLKDYCKDKGGTYQQTDSGASCSVIKKGDKYPVVISCGNKTKICIETHTQVFTSPKRSTHGPIGGGFASTLGKTSVSGGASGANASAGDGKSASQNASGSGAGNAINVSGSGTGTTVGAGGGNPPRNGRQLFRQQ